MRNFVSICIFYNKTFLILIYSSSYLLLCLRIPWIKLILIMNSPSSFSISSILKILYCPFIFLPTPRVLYLPSRKFLHLIVFSSSAKVRICFLNDILIFFKLKIKDIYKNRFLKQESLVQSIYSFFFFFSTINH